MLLDGTPREASEPRYEDRLQLGDWPTAAQRTQRNTGETLGRYTLAIPYNQPNQAPVITNQPNQSTSLQFKNTVGRL